MKKITALFIVLIQCSSYMLGQIECEAVNKHFVLEYECNSIEPLEKSLLGLEEKFTSFFNDSIPKRIHYFRMGIPAFNDSCEYSNSLGYKRIEYLSNYLRTKYQEFENVTIVSFDNNINETLKFGSTVVGLFYDFPPSTCKQ